MTSFPFFCSFILFVRYLDQCWHILIPNITMILLAQIQGQHTNALECAARGGARCSASCAGRSDRSDRFAGVNQRVRRTLAREGPVRASARRGVLGSAGHLERLQTSSSCKKNSRYGVGGARVWIIQKVMKSNVLICFWSIGCPQSDVALYIYRLGRSCSARKFFIDLKHMN